MVRQATWSSVSLQSTRVIAECGRVLIIGLLSLSWFVTSASVNEAKSVQEVQTIEFGKPVQQAMTGGQSYSYNLTLEAGQYLRIVVEQQGIDVIVTLFGPGDENLMEVDSSNGRDGQELLKYVAKSPGNHRLHLRSISDNGVVGHYEVKITALRTATPQDRALAEAFILSKESERLKKAGSYDDAVSRADRALALLENNLPADHLDIAQALNDLAILFADFKQNYAKAEPLYLHALEIRKKVLGTDHPDVAATIGDLGAMYRDNGSLAKAEPLLQQALNVREKAFGLEHQHVASSLNDLAKLYSRKGDYTKAEPLYQRVLEIREKTHGTNHQSVANALNNLALLYTFKGDYTKAEPMYQRAINIWEKVLGPEHPYLASSLNNLAMLYDKRGEYGKAEQSYERTLAIQEKTLGPDHPNVATTYNNLGSLYDEKGDYAMAERFLQRAYEIWVKALGPEHPNIATSLNNLAGVHKKQGNYAKAKSLLQQAITILEKEHGANHPSVVNLFNGLAVVILEEGDYAQAESLFKRALAIREKALGAEHPDVASTLNNLAGLYSRKGDYAQAEPLFKRALAIREKALGAEHPDTAQSLNDLASLYNRKDDVTQAIAFRSRASAVEERNIALNTQTGSERQKAVYLATLMGRTEATISLHARSAPNNPAARDLALTVILQRKGRALDAMTDSIAALRRQASPQEQALLDRLQEARSLQARLVLNGPQKMTPAEHQARIKTAEEQVERLEAEVSSRSSAFRAQAQAVTLASVQAAIPAEATLIEFFSYQPSDPKVSQLGDRRYIAYVLRPQGAAQWIELGEAKAIDATVAELRQALRDKARTDVKSLARNVDRLVMQPLRPLLGKTRRVLLSPDGALNLVPFAALVDERSRYLVEQYSFSYLTSGRDLLRLQVPRASKSAPLVVANPDFGPIATTASKQDGGAQVDLSQVYFKPLVGTAGEARALKTLLPQATVLIKDQATEAALKRTSAPSILHVATHGFFLEDQEATSAEARKPERPGGEKEKESELRLSKLAAKVENPLLRSGLALAGANQGKSGDDDGVLTAMEAAGLNLWGTKLVVLSACDTGVGEVKNGDGVYGLRRALVLAGSETQVMSLWPVSDTETRDLMIAYYTALKEGQGRGEALRQVQLKMLRSKNRRHPHYWASFIQSGEWANLDGKR